MGRRSSVIYVNGNSYCHCPQPGHCDNVHAADEGVPNDDIARFRLVYSGDGDELYHDVDDAMLDLLGVGVTKFTPFESGDAQMVDLQTGETWDATDFRDAHL